MALIKVIAADQFLATNERDMEVVSYESIHGATTTSLGFDRSSAVQRWVALPPPVVGAEAPQTALDDDMVVLAAVFSSFWLAVPAVARIKI
jgi:hypothetical protein